MSVENPGIVAARKPNLGANILRGAVVDSSVVAAVREQTRGRHRPFRADQLELLAEGFAQSGRTPAESVAQVELE